jgi:transcription initiation factor TFIID subunit TAF12
LKGNYATGFALVQQQQQQQQQQQHSQTQTPTASGTSPHEESKPLPIIADVSWSSTESMFLLLILN